MLRVSSHDLAEALARRLDELAPARITVRAQGPDVAVLHNGQVVGISGAPAILETIEALREPAGEPGNGCTGNAQRRPGLHRRRDDGALAGHRRTQPNPDARVHEDTVSMWFGSEDAPVLRLPPIDLSRAADRRASTAPRAPGP